MAYLMHIIDQESSEGFDVTELVYNITHTTTLQGQAGKLTFNLKKDPNNILQISMGSTIKFWCDEVPVFYGYVFNMKTNSEEVYQITAYDQMRYLKNHDYYLLENQNLQEVFKKICQDGLLLKENQNEKGFKILGRAKIIQETELPKQVFNDQSYFDILQYAIDNTNSRYVQEQIVGGDGKVIFTNVDVENDVDFSIPVKYFIRDNFGVLELNDIESNVKYRKTGIDGNTTRVWTGSEWYYYDENQVEQLEPLIIGDESLLIDYDYQLDIDQNTYNELLIMTDIKDEKENKKSEVNNKTEGVQLNKELKYARQSSNNEISKWGKLRKIINLKNSNVTEAEIEQYAKLSLLEGAQVNKTLKLEALGYNGVNAGDGFLLRLKKLGIEQMMYVISATHNYDGNKHIMSLQVATSRNLTEVLK